MSEGTRKPILNIPAGNSRISDTLETERPVAGTWLEAFKSIRPVHDLENIGQIPCARKSLLSGIAGGAGIGAVRFLGSQKPKIAANWAIGSFMLISIFQWTTCNRARAKELAQMREIQERFPHISQVKHRKD